jgi:hypothetical protein
MHRFKFTLKSNTDNFCEGVLGFMRNLYSNANAWFLQSFGRDANATETPASAGTSTPAFSAATPETAGTPVNKQQGTYNNSKETSYRRNICRSLMPTPG